MAGIQEVGWVSICQISLLQWSFTDILQLCLFPCFWKTPEIRQFTFMDHSEALCKTEHYCFGNYYSTFQNYQLENLKKPRYFSICSVLPKDRHFLFRRSHQIRGHYRKIRKKGQGYAICIARNWREYQRVLVYKTIGKKPFNSLLQVTWIFCTHVKEKAL